MGKQYSCLLKNGTVVDPVSNLNAVCDIAITDGKIAEISVDIDPTLAQEVFDVRGMFVVPGIIDLHMHASAWLGGKFGHKMMAQVGVTTALDMSGPLESVLDIAGEHGVGLNIACIEYVRPGHTVSTADPSESELQDFLARTMSHGSLGFKLLGGHYPLTPEATARTIEVVNKNKAYVAFHAGTLQNGSNINGFLEAVDLAGGNSLHIAHVNSYCRGQVRDYMAETEEAIAALEKNPNISCESYLSPLNGTSSKCSNGIPESLVTQKCLATGGFPATEDGLEQAMLAGWAQLNVEAGGKMVLATGEEAVAYWRSRGTDGTISFSVNPPEPRIRLATAKRASGSFVVDCISTDGGGIPRNVIVEMGLALVKLQALTMPEFVQKTSVNPARILGLSNKGHFSLGADADITVLDVDSQSAFMSMVAGKVIMYRGYVCGRGSKIVTTKAGEKYVREKGLQPIVVELAESAFYRR